MADLLFVYGTLRRGSGHPMAARLAREATFLGPARWAGELHDFGDHPGALSGAGRGEVVGDLYRLEDAATIGWLDEYEELAAPPKDPWFVRERVEVEAAGGRLVKAWMYRFAGPGTAATLVPSGDYVAHRAALAKR